MNDQPKTYIIEFSTDPAAKQRPPRPWVAVLAWSGVHPLDLVRHGRLTVAEQPKRTGQR